VGGIRGKTPKDCFDQFVAHLNELVQATLSRDAHLRIDALDEKGILQWSDGKFLPIGTQFGRLYFWLAQSLECSFEPKESANKREIAAVLPSSAGRGVPPDPRRRRATASGPDVAADRGHAAGLRDQRARPQSQRTSSGRRQGDSEEGRSC